MSMIHMEKSRAMKECRGARIPGIIVETMAFLAIFILFQLTGPLAQPFVPMLVRGMDETDVYVVLTAVTNLMFLSLILFSMLYCLLLEKRSLASMGFYGNGGKSIFTGLAAGFFLTVLVAGIQILTGAGLVEWAGTLPVSTGILFFLTTLIQSSGEEILCRGYFMNSLGSRRSWVFAAVFNSLIFGAIHLLNPGVSPLAIANVVIAGIFFSVITIRYNLWAACGVHAMWNFSEGYIFGSNISGNAAKMSVFAVSPSSRPTWLTGGEFGIEGSIVVTIIYIIGIAAVLCLPRPSKGRAES